MITKRVIGHIKWPQMYIYTWIFITMKNYNIHYSLSIIANHLSRYIYQQLLLGRVKSTKKRLSLLSRYSVAISFYWFLQNSEPENTQPTKLFFGRLDAFLLSRIMNNDSRVNIKSMYFLQGLRSVVWYASFWVRTGPSGASSCGFYSSKGCGRTCRSKDTRRVSLECASFRAQSNSISSSGSWRSRNSGIPSWDRVSTATITQLSLVTTFATHFEYNPLAELN